MLPHFVDFLEFLEKKQNQNECSLMQRQVLHVSTNFNALTPEELL